MKRRSILLFGVLAVLYTFLPCAFASKRIEHRGHRWIRSHPFTIMGLVRMSPTSFDATQYRAAEFSSLLAWEPATYEKLLPIAAGDGMPYHVHLEKWGDEEANRENSNEQTLREALRSLDSEENRAYVARLAENPGCVGFLVNDEPVRTTYLRHTRQVLKWLRKQHPDKLAYSNAHPEGYDGDFSRYIDEFAAIVNPDVLVTDFYPLGHPDGTAKIYFKVLEAHRAAALEHGMPYWMFIQAFETHETFDRRLPSESDLRFQLFSLLTYGYTGLIYFTYDAGFERGVLEKHGGPNQLFYSAAKANPEVANLGKTLRFLTSADIRFVPGQHEENGSIVRNSLPIDSVAWTRDAGQESRIADIVVDSSGEEKDGLVGFFVDDHGGQYFMLTNLWHNGEASAADRELGFTLKFAPVVKKLFRLNRLSGRAESVSLNDGAVQIRLPGGTGDLFKFDDDVFPGSE